ncbi:tyrosine-type recombinase/integrase [Boseongicola aestuarii]|uniref:Prophage CP4-57 integrase n=1 Tax=Boseongicola aestuarii TaxID=1470561 RepID=A0A238IZC0_9RHOB|nr:site-specific integrase [Boseongicola aestuarii]SMX23829.1 Prophage CP4-57 integrase [Boseongicola aestuarii]
MSGITSKKSKPLSAAVVASVKTPGKYHDGKGTGLFLLVKKSGARSWVQRLMVQGKRREIGLGSPPFVTLAEARDRALDNKRIAVSGGDPLAEKRKNNLALSFEEAARRTHKELAPTWKNPKDRAAFLSTLERYVFPRFGRVALSEVSSADIRQAILAARELAPGVAKKLTYRISSVFKWGIAEGHCLNNPATSDALALPRDPRTVSHRKALPYSKVRDCIETVKASGAGATTKLALEFLILTATRSGETRLARWDEFDLEGGSETTTATWTVPADRMKMKRPHRVPLCGRAVEILREARDLSDGSDLVFPGTKHGKPLSDMTLSKLVKELGFDADVHGFRTSFRTWGQEQTDFPRDVQEAALGHKMGDAAEQAYARSDLFIKRQEMMERWSDFLWSER